MICRWIAFAFVCLVASSAQKVDGRTGRARRTSESPWSEARDWKVDSGEGSLRGKRVSRVEALGDNGFTASLDTTKLDWTPDENGKVFMPLILPEGEEVMFEFERSQVMHPALQALFPDILTFTGMSIGFERVLYANVDYSPRKGLRAFIRDVNADYFIDPLRKGRPGFENDDKYRAYRGIDLIPDSDWACTVKDGEHDHHHDNNHTMDGSQLGRGSTRKEEEEEEEEEDDETTETRRRMRRRRTTTTTTTTRTSTPGGPKAKEYLFTIAIVANGQYSSFHGNTNETVLAEIVTVMNRVNGIFKRELSVYFQLHPKTVDLICLDPCESLSNSQDILLHVNDFMAKRGVEESSYDLGHSFSTGSGGLACLGALCDGSRKSCGTTGLVNPESDAFYVDYVSHEIGHQLRGDHTFQDCGGYRGGRDSSVEPGSGSTILAYAGICGSSYNLQWNSDPYFHSKSLEQMLTYVDEKASGDGSCGVVLEKERQKPVIDISAHCTIPANNPFQVSMKVSNSPQEENENAYYYTIEPIESDADADFLDKYVFRFRSWVPTTRPFRTFPNMYYLIHGMQDSVYDEILPKRSQSFQMRATARESYSPTQLGGDSGIASGFGTFGYADITIHAVDSLGPLKFTSQFRQGSSGVLNAGTFVNFEWDVANTEWISSRVRIMVAKDEMPYVGRIIDYDNHIKVLDWIQIAETENDGEELVHLPILEEFSQDSTFVHLMIRSVSENNPDCFFFDLIPNVEYVNVAPTAEPTTEPSLSPSVTPSKSPTKKPTSFPSISPSLEPTNAPSYGPTTAPTTYPSESPTHGPTGSPTMHTREPSKEPTTSPTTRSPTTNSPSISPSTSPTTRSPTTNSPSISPSTRLPTRLPTSLPTGLPTNTPSKIPTKLPSRSPTLSPTNTPSKSPTLLPSRSPTLSPSISETLYPTIPEDNSTERRSTQNPTQSPQAKVVQRPGDFGGLNQAKNPSNASQNKVSVLLKIGFIWLFWFFIYN